MAVLTAPVINFGGTPEPTTISALATDLMASSIVVLNTVVLPSPQFSQLSTADTAAYAS